MEKADDVEIKAKLQFPFYVRNIDARCLKDQCPSVKKDKENIY